MYDIDLFARKHPKPKQTNYFAITVIAILVLMASLIFFFEFSFLKNKFDFDSQIVELEDAINDPVTVERLRKVDEEKMQNVELERVLERLNIVDAFMDVSNTVYYGLVEQISKCVPENCFISDISIQNQNIEISGFADSYEAVAQLQHQLREIEKLSYVFNPSITKDGANYSYSVSAVLRVEVTNEN